MSARALCTQRCLLSCACMHVWLACYKLRGKSEPHRIASASRIIIRTHALSLLLGCSVRRTASASAFLYTTSSFSVRICSHHGMRHAVNGAKHFLPCVQPQKKRKKKAVDARCHDDGDDDGDDYEGVVVMRTAFDAKVISDW